MPFVAATSIIDADPSRAAIDRQLAGLEDAARHDGKALGLALAAQPVVEQVAAWAAGLEKRGLVLAPVSAVAVASPVAPIKLAKPAGAKGIAGETPPPVEAGKR
jgi:polysaccharide deacetylase 2 family uncharacterized protein YibQ